MIHDGVVEPHDLPIPLDWAEEPEALDFIWIVIVINGLPFLFEIRHVVPHPSVINHLSADEVGNSAWS